jgi:hypothetical protein
MLNFEGSIRQAAQRRRFFWVPRCVVVPDINNLVQPENPLKVSFV